MSIQTRDLAFSTPEGSRVGFLATPERARGAVVIAHEIFGRAPEIERAAERLARAGFAALMPDLFGARFKPLCIARAMREVREGRGEFVSVLRAAGDAVAKESGVPRGRVAVVGFCMGAGLALAVGNAFGAVSTNYGDPPPLEVLRGIGPTIACYGGLDRSQAKTPAVIRERLSALGVVHEVHVFETAGHAFMTDGHHPVAEALTRPLLQVNAGRDAAAREEAWTHVLAFLEKHATTAAAS